MTSKDQYLLLRTAYERSGARGYASPVELGVLIIPNISGLMAFPPLSDRLISRELLSTVAQLTENSKNSSNLLSIARKD